MIKGVTQAYLGPIWYHKEPSDVPYFPNQVLGWDFFWPLLKAKPALTGFYGCFDSYSNTFKF